MSSLAEKEPPLLNDRPMIGRKLANTSKHTVITVIASGLHIRTSRERQLFVAKHLALLTFSGRQ